MPNIIKQEQGLLFEENFNDPSLIWTLSPSNANNLEFANNKLQIKHIDEYVTYTIIEPDSDEYACIVKIDHAPYDTNDIAGVIILHTNKQYIECQTFLSTNDSKIGTQYVLNELIQELDLDSKYTRYRVNDGSDDDSSSQEQKNENEEEDESSIYNGDVKYNYLKIHKKNGKYSFYASSDNFEWIEVGDVSFNYAGAIGFFIYPGTEEIIQNSHCYIEQFDIYKSKYVKIYGIPENSNFEIHDDTHVICRSDTPNYNNTVKYFENGVLINTTMLKMPINPCFIRFFEKGNYQNTIAEYNLGKVYGGDEFNISTDVRFYINDDDEIIPGEITDLGNLYIGKTYIKLIVKNCDEILSSSRTVSIERYSDYYSGNKPILMSISDLNQVPEYSTFSNSVIIPELEPQESINLFLCLKEKSLGDYFLNSNELRFKLIIN